MKYILGKSPGMPGKNGRLSMKCQTCSTSDFACFANRANWLRQHLPRVGSGQPAGHGRPGQFARGGVLGCKRGAGGSRGRHVEGRGGGLGGSSGEKIGETAAKPGTPQLPRTIQRCCPNISRSLQMTFAWLTVRVLGNVAVQTPWEDEMFTIMGNDWQLRGTLN